MPGFLELCEASRKAVYNKCPVFVCARVCVYVCERDRESVRVSMCVCQQQPNFFVISCIYKVLIVLVEIYTSKVV